MIGFRWALVAAAALVLPAHAAGSVYCAGTAGADCNGGVFAATGDGLQAAITAADTNVDIAGTPDTVRIGPGRYQRTSGAGFVTSGGDLTIAGSGPATVLTTDTTPGREVLTVSGGGTASSLRDLNVELAGPSAGISGFVRVSDVRVAGPGPAGYGIRMPPAGRLSRAVVEPDRVSPGGVGVNALSGIVEDVVIRLRGGGGSLVKALAVGDDAPTTTATVRHLTVIGDGAPLTVGILAQAVGTPSSARTVVVTVRDTLLRNLAAPLRRFATTAYPAYPGTARIEFRYSALDLTPGANVETGPGALVNGPGNLDDPDPLLGGDLEPLAGSPLIDAGDPAGPEANDSPADALGRPRIFGPRRDIGALERQSSSPGTPPAGPAGLAPPVLSDLSISPRAFRPAPRRGRATPDQGATVRFSLSADARALFAVKRVLPGRRVGRRCVAPTAVNRGRPGCARQRTRGAFSQAGLAGPNSLRFRGRLAGRALVAGQYRLVATPRSAAGVRGRPVAVRFRILGPP